MSNYFVFTDEAGAYQQRPSNKFIKSHPYYVRANVIMSIDDYRQYQMDMQRISGEYEIPFDEEIKWSDLWRKMKNNPRNRLIERMPESRLKGYYRRIFETAISKDSTRFLFTLTDIIGRTCRWSSDFVYKTHLQDAFQRIQMDMEEDDFATFVMDELNTETLIQIKAACHYFTVQGDFVTYKNIYQGILTENSLYSPGIQLADYAAGVINGFLRGQILYPGSFQFATDLYNEFICPRLRKSNLGQIVGYGIVDIPKRTPFRGQLEAIFDQ